LCIDDFAHLAGISGTNAPRTLLSGYLVNREAEPVGLILLWLLGIPLPIIIILFLLWH
jgi:hypothetical protein